MTKYCIKKYPLGSLPNQKTEGKYIDGYLYNNLKDLAEVIVNDMTFLAFIFSSTLEVGTGKSVLAQQIAECWIDLVNTIHKKDLPDFSTANLVFKPKDLIEKSFKIPKYSVIILDEWEDAHYWSELGMSLRQFFRKCRQLNLFMICIIPNFFELRPSYAISRSVFAIDVRFEGKFERGYFRFYNFDKKRELYIKGKKEQNYNVTLSNFQGRFLDGYAMNEETYRKAKRRDLEDYEENEKKTLNPSMVRRKLVHDIAQCLPIMTQVELGKAIGLSGRSVNRYANEDYSDDEEGGVLEPEASPQSPST